MLPATSSGSGGGGNGGGGRLVFPSTRWIKRKSSFRETGDAAQNLRQTARLELLRYTFQTDLETGFNELWLAISHGFGSRWADFMTLVRLFETLHKKRQAKCRTDPVTNELVQPSVTNCYTGERTTRLVYSLTQHAYHTSLGDLPIQHVYRTPNLIHISRYWLFVSCLVESKYDYIQATSIAIKDFLEEVQKSTGCCFLPVRGPNNHTPTNNTPNTPNTPIINTQSVDCSTTTTGFSVCKSASFTPETGITRYTGDSSIVFQYPNAANTAFRLMTDAPTWLRRWKRGRQDGQSAMEFLKQMNALLELWCSDCHSHSHSAFWFSDESDLTEWVQHFDYLYQTAVLSSTVSSQSPATITRYMVGFLERYTGPLHYGFLQLFFHGRVANTAGVLRFPHVATAELYQHLSHDIVLRSTDYSQPQQQQQNYHASIFPPPTTTSFSYALASLDQLFTHWQAWILYARSCLHEWFYMFKVSGGSTDVSELIFAYTGTLVPLVQPTELKQRLPSEPRLRILHHDALPGLDLRPLFYKLQHLR